MLGLNQVSVMKKKLYMHRHLSIIRHCIEPSCKVELRIGVKNPVYTFQKTQKTGGITAGSMPERL
jgi:hypothetical protein